MLFISFTHSTPQGFSCIYVHISAGRDMSMWLEVRGHPQLIPRLLSLVLWDRSFSRVPGSARLHLSQCWGCSVYPHAWLFTWALGKVLRPSGPHSAQHTKAPPFLAFWNHFSPSTKACLAIDVCERGLKPRYTEGRERVKPLLWEPAWATCHLPPQTGDCYLSSVSSKRNVWSKHACL